MADEGIPEEGDIVTGTKLGETVGIRDDGTELNGTAVFGANDVGDIEGVLEEGKADDGYADDGIKLGNKLGVADEGSILDGTTVDGEKEVGEDDVGNAVLGACEDGNAVTGFIDGCPIG